MTMGPDETEDFERAVAILLGLMAQCSAAEWNVAHAERREGERPAAIRARRQAYLTTMVRDLDPADPVVVEEVLRTYGPRLTDAAANDLSHNAFGLSDTDRLEPDMHGFLFERGIYPELVSRDSPAGYRADTSSRWRDDRDQCRALIVTGLPGSGTTARVRTVRDEWRSTGSVGFPVVIDPRLLLAYHPRGWQIFLSAEHSPKRGAVLADVSDWAALMLDYAIEWRHDIVVDAAIADFDVAESCAVRLRENGYHVETEHIRVPEGSVEPQVAGWSATLDMSHRHHRASRIRPNSPVMRNEL